MRDRQPVNAAAEWLAPRPPVLRKLVWRLPERLQPTITPEVWAVAFDPDTGAPVAGLHTTHPDFGQTTGVVEHAGRLWLGCIGNPAVAHCALPAREASSEKRPATERNEVAVKQVPGRRVVTLGQKPRPS